MEVQAGQGANVRSLPRVRTEVQGIAMDFEVILGAVGLVGGILAAIYVALSVWAVANAKVKPRD